MKTTKILLTAIIATLMFSWNAAMAQEGNYYTVTTWKMHVPEDGSRAELTKLLQDFADKVVKKNDKLISQRVLHHIYGNDLRDLVVISEYANWMDIEAAGEMQNKLVEAAWPDETERAAWNKSFFKYVVTHSDEIYQEHPDMRK